MVHHAQEGALAEDGEAGFRESGVRYNRIVRTRGQDVGLTESLLRLWWGVIGALGALGGCADEGV